MASDLISNLIDDWKKERPDLNADGMSVCGRILRLGRLLEDDVNKTLKKFDLQYTELDVLATLRRKGSPFQLKPKQLIESVLITSGAMTACLDRLEKRKLLVRLSDPNDRRGRIIALTPEGVALIDQAIELRFKQASKSLSGLTQSDQIKLSGLLEKLSLTYTPIA
ncbi:MarR family winged helix-turn-helix transcriptional regulator [Marinicella sp. W31]|uniref:MarR family winged helix-turn-helix transcriptional regulator n=1 Tax=Marinicella sp. W31 TaxID=3023713 RepID=UPI0037569E9D